MRASAPKASLTVAEYHRMIEAGVLLKDDRIELLEGAMVAKPRISRRHAACVDDLTRIFVQGAGDRAVVRIQNPITLGDLSEPEPDVVVARNKEGGYREQHPGAQDVLLLVEVSDTSHRYDDTVKLPLYAREGVREVWRVDLESETLIIHREPRDDAYRSVSTAHTGDSVAPEALPDLLVSVETLFP